MRTQDFDERRKRARALYDAGRLDDAAGMQVALVNEAGAAATRDDHRWLGLILFARGDHAGAAAVLERLLARWPDDTESKGNLGVLLGRAGRHGDAVPWLEAAIAEGGETANLHDALAHVHGHLGDREAARRHAEAALRLKDAAVGAGAGLAAALPPPPPFRADAPDRNVIAFSLWGRNLRYLDGAVANARLAREIYPEWRCRFFIDDSVPAATRGELLAAGADLVQMPPPRRLHEGLFWRFLAWEAPGVDRFLVRDADAVVNRRERAAVDEWIASGRHFHLMRDYHTHTDLVLAGMWGGVGGLLPTLAAEKTGALTRTTRTNKCDQEFLGQYVWPLIRRHVLIHDSRFRLFGARDFPAGALLPPDRHVGQSAHAHRPPPPGRLLGHAADARPKLLERRRFVYGFTTGRSGSAFLAELLRRNWPAAEVHHERATFLQLGRHSPDASHFTEFNSLGNTPRIREFWRAKLAADRVGEGPAYVEVSHLLAKAGLIENLGLLPEGSTVDVVCLARDPAAIAASLANRYDFANYGFTWLWWLDPRYARNIVDPAPFGAGSLYGQAAWYVTEMAARRHYYRRLFAGLPWLRFVDADLARITTPAGAADLLARLGVRLPDGRPDLPGRQNETAGEGPPDEVRAEIARLLAGAPDPAEAAERYIAAGRRLG